MGIRFSPGCCCEESSPCGELCDYVCEGASYALPGTVETSAGAHPIGKAGSYGGGFQPIWAFPPGAGVYDSGTPRWQFNSSTNCYEQVGTVKYFFAIRCDGAQILLSIFINAVEYGGQGEGDPEDVDGCGHYWPNGTMFASSISPELAAGKYALASEIAIDESDVECGGDLVITFDFGVLHTYAPDPPLSGTVTLPGRGSEPFDVACCEPCSIPKSNLALTIGATSGALSYDDASTSWIGSGTTLGIKLECSASGAALSNPNFVWTLDEANSTCDPFHLKFTRATGAPAYVDG